MKCDSCGRDVFRATFMPESKRYLGVDCGCKKEAMLTSAFNPWSDVTLAHVHNEKGEPIRITSVHQMREAEKRYGFEHHLANANEVNFSTPRQQKAYSVGDHYKRKFARG